MNWKLDKERPICPQICEHICVDIASQRYESGDKLPSVRELALEIGVNPNTVQRSYEILEHQGIIYTERNLGRFVSDDTEIAKHTLEELARKKTEEYFSGMELLGFNTETVKKYIEEWS